MKKLTGVFVIETGVVNRGDGIGNIATVKKVTTHEGIKVFFSPVSYKRALWTSLEEGAGWNPCMVTRDSGVVQRTGTIIDSEEFDFAGTMIAKPRYSRNCTFLVDKGISINNYAGDTEFMTNMALANKYGQNEANIINKENFHGIYIMPFVIELYRVGLQEIEDIKIDFDKDDPKSKKISKIYQALKLKDRIASDELAAKVDDITKDDKKTIIRLTLAERKKRISSLLRGMGDLGRRIEGSPKNLTPFFAAFSVDYQTPKYFLAIKKLLSENNKLEKKDIVDFGSKESKTIHVAGIDNYDQIVSNLVSEIETIWSTPDVKN